MSDTRTDDEIAELFAAVNPVPADWSRSAGPHGEPPRPTDADAVVVEIDNPPPDSSDVRSRDRWWLVAAVAAAISLIVSLVVATTVRDDPRPADEPSTTLPTIPPTEPEASTSPDIETVDDFIAAFNDHDVDAMISLSTDQLDFDGRGQGDQLAYLMEWYASFDWRWEEAECVTGGDGQVSCQVFERNRLTDHTGAERPARVVFTLDGTSVERVESEPDNSQYSPTAFVPFQRWVAENHPSDAARMWNDEDGGISPVIGAGTATLLDQHLTEYLSINSDQSRVETAFAFIGAINSYDADAAREILGDAAPVAITPVSPGDAVANGTTVDGQLAWLDAWGWRLGDANCRAVERAHPPDRAQLGNLDPTYDGPIRGVDFDAVVKCGFTSSTRLGAAPDRYGRGLLHLRLLDGKITYAEMFPTENLELGWSDVTRPFEEWAAAERSGAWADARGEKGPLLTAESAEVERRLLDEFLELDNGDTGDG